MNIKKSLLILFTLWGVSVSLLAEEGTKNKSNAANDVRRDYSFGYWSNGWLKTPDDTSPDTLAFEGGYYGIELNVDKLDEPRFGLYDDKLSYLEATKAGHERLNSLKPAKLAIELEVDGVSYRAYTCRAGVDKDKQRFESVLLWESGRYEQHFELQDLQFRNDKGVPLPVISNLQLMGWPGSLVFEVTACPDLVYNEGPGRGISGNAYCMIEKPLVIPHSPKLEAEQFTAELWVNIPAKLQGNNFGWFMGKNGNELDDGAFGFMRIGDSFQAVVNIGGGAQNLKMFRGGPKLESGTWYHLALTYDGKFAKYYVNGMMTQVEIGRKRKKGNGVLRIGKRADNKLTVMPGLYDQFRFWNRALSAEEIQAHTKEPSKLPSRKGLTYEENFDKGKTVELPSWKEAKMRITLESGNLKWTREKLIKSEWKKGDHKKLTMVCDMPNAKPVPRDVKIQVTRADGVVHKAAYNEETNCMKVLVPKFKRSWPGAPTADSGTGNNYDDFLLEVENPGNKYLRVPFQFHIIAPGSITGLVPLLCEEDGTPTGVPVQLSKDWHFGTPYLHAFTYLPAPVGKKRYKFRIVYGFYGQIPSASYNQLSLVGWGRNGRWDQLAIGSWGETFCLNMDMSAGDICITDVRCLFVRYGNKGGKWQWSDAGWGGDWLGLFNAKGEKFGFSGQKVAYLAHGPCLGEAFYDGDYGPVGGVDMETTVRIPRVDDYARTFQTLRYTFKKDMSAQKSYLYRMGGGFFISPKVAYGNRDGLIKEYDVPQGTMKKDEPLCPPFTLTGKGPWWVAYPGGNPNPPKYKGNSGTRALIIRKYRATIGGKTSEQPTISLKANLFVTGNHGGTDINLYVLPPLGTETYRAGDSIELDVEWVTLPRLAENYYGPNEAFRKHMEKNPNSWKTVHREAVGNDLKLKVKGGSVINNYPIIIKAEADTIEVDVEGGVGFVPIRFEGLKTPKGYALYEVKGGKETKLDQALRGNDYWQTDLDTGTALYRMTFNIPCDGKPTSRWILKQN